MNMNAPSLQNTTAVFRTNWRCFMKKFLYYGSYTADGYKGLMAEGGSKRAEAVKQALKSVGGTLESFYFAFGENDFYVIISVPDRVSAAAFAMTGSMSGSVVMKTVVLLTPEEIDEAIKKTVDFRPPGKK